MIRYLVAAFVLGSVSAPALSQACPRPAGWAKPARHLTAAQPRFRFALKPDSSAELALRPVRSVTLATKKPGRTSGYAGLAAIDVAKAGKLDVLLSERAYVDLVRNGQPLKSAAHGRKNCNGIFKSVSFDVAPGRYIVQISDSEAKTLRIATISH